MAALAPRLMMALSKGDDGLLRTVVEVFEEQGFAVVGAHEVLPSLVAEPGLSVGANFRMRKRPTPTRAVEILKGISSA